MSYLFLHSVWLYYVWCARQARRTLNTCCSLRLILLAKRPTSSGTVECGNRPHFTASICYMRNNSRKISFYLVSCQQETISRKSEWSDAHESVCALYYCYIPCCGSYLSYLKRTNFEIDQCSSEFIMALFDISDSVETSALCLISTCLRVGLQSRCPRNSFESK